MNGARRAFAGAALAITLTATGGVAASAHGGSHGHKAPATKVFTLAPDPAASPEGIAVDSRTKQFFVSDTGDGAIYSGMLGNPTVTPFIDGSPATRRRPQGPEGQAVRRRRRHRHDQGVRPRDEGARGVVRHGAGGFLNDLVVTGKGDVFVTDSFRPMIWHVTADR